jgi:NADH:ubiquinone oxidoreductase subunit E
MKNLELLEKYINTYQYDADVELSGSRCEEECRKGPNIQFNGQMFHGVNEAMLLDLLKRHVEKNQGE